MIESDYYELLGVERNASKADLKRAYYSQVKIYTPEKDPDRFKALREAYEFLLDDKKRADYDKYADLPTKEAGIAQEAKRLMYNNNYSDAITLLKGKKKNEELERLLAEAYLKNGNSGLAIKILEGLLRRNPEVPEVYLQLAESYEARGFHVKAQNMIETAMQKFPDSAAAVCDYIWMLHHQDSHLPSDIFDKIEPIAGSIAAYDFSVLVICIVEAMYYKQEGIISFLYAHYADGLIAAKRVTDNQYDNAVGVTMDLVLTNECLETCKKVADFLEHDPRKDKHSEAVRMIREAINLADLRNMNIINVYLMNLTCLLSLNTDFPQHKLHVLRLEHNLIYDEDSARASLKILQDDYPQYFELNKEFYLELMNPRRYRRLKSRYDREVEKQKKLHPDFFSKYESSSMDYLDTKGKGSLDDLSESVWSAFNSLSSKQQKDLKEVLKQIALDPEVLDLDFDDLDDDDFFDEFSEPYFQPYVRTERKVGRNEPCPCGSGKKYKQCCGRVNAHAANQ